MCINLYFWKLLFIKAAATNLLGLRKKETPTTQVFSCKICEIFKNTYFEEHLRMAASLRVSNDDGELEMDLK